jgi:hypothetical protein
MSLVQRHLKYTGSTVARGLLNNWSMARAAFVKVFPVEYRRALEQQAAERARPRPGVLARLGASRPRAHIVSVKTGKPGRASGISAATKLSVRPHAAAACGGRPEASAPPAKLASPLQAMAESHTPDRVDNPGVEGPPGRGCRRRGRRRPPAAAA